MEIKSIVGAKFGSLSLNRSTSTNPFDKTSFKGKTFSGSVLPFADVFQAIKPVSSEKPNKIKLIAGAVIGSVVDFKTRVKQSAIALANKVKENVALGIDKVKGVKTSIINAKNSLVEMNKNVKDRISQVFDWHRVKEPEPDGVPKVLSLKDINEHASVQDLKATWIHENEKLSGKEGKVAA